MKQTQTYIKSRYSYFRTIYPTSFQNIPVSFNQIPLQYIQQNSGESDDEQGMEQDQNYPSFYDKFSNSKHPYFQQSITKEKEILTADLRDNKSALDSHTPYPQIKQRNDGEAQILKINLSDKQEKGILISQMKEVPKKPQILSQDEGSNQQSGSQLVKKQREQQHQLSRNNSEGIENSKIQKFIKILQDQATQKIISSGQIDKKNEQLEEFIQKPYRVERNFEAKQNKTENIWQSNQNRSEDDIQQRFTQSKLQFSSLFKEQKKNQFVEREENKMKLQINSLKQFEDNLKQKIQSLEMQKSKNQYVTKLNLLAGMKKLQKKFEKQIQSNTHSKQETNEYFRKKILKVVEKFPQLQEKEKKAKREYTLLEQKISESERSFSQQIKNLRNSLTKQNLLKI